MLLVSLACDVCVLLWVQIPVLLFCFLGSFPIGAKCVDSVLWHVCYVCVSCGCLSVCRGVVYIPVVLVLPCVSLLMYVCLC